MPIEIATTQRPFVQHVDIGDGGEPVALHYAWPLDRVSDQLRDCRTPGEAQDIWWGLYRSMRNAAAKRKEAGPMGWLYDALQMCDRRYRELAAALGASGQKPATGQSVAVEG